jgi:hypothetical protein
MTDNVQVTISATVDQFVDALNTAQEQFQGVIDQMVSKVNELSGAMDDKLSESASKVEQSFSGIGESFEGLKSMVGSALEFAGVGLAVEAFKQLDEQISLAAEHAVNIKQLAEVFGTTKMEMQGLQAAAAEASVPQQQLTMALGRLDQEMQQARDSGGEMADKLLRVGITSDDLSNTSFTAANALYKLAASGASSGEIMDLLSRRGMLVAEMFPLIAGGQAAMEAEAERLDGINGKQIDTLLKYEEGLNAVAIAYDNYKLKAAADSAAAAGSINTDWIQIKIELIGGFKEFIDVVTGSVDRAMSEIRLVGGTLADVFSFSWGKIGADWKGHMENIADVAAASMKKIQGDVKEANDAITAVVAAASHMNDAVSNTDTRPKTGGSADDFFPASQIKEGMTEAESALKQYNDASAAYAKQCADVIEAQGAEAGAYLEQQYKEQLRTAQTAYDMQVKAYDQMLNKIDKDADAAGNFMSTQLDKAFTEMSTKAESFGQAMQGVWQNIEASFAKMALQLVFHWAAMETAQLAESVATSHMKLTNAAATAAQADAINKASGAQQILVDAKKAAAGAYSSASEVPVIGWLLGPAAAAAAFAATAAFASFDQGGIVPADITANVHKDEMVLPPHLSRGIQAMIASGGGGGGGNFTFQGSFMDSKSVERFYRNPANMDALARAMNKSFRRGGSGTRARAP